MLETCLSKIYADLLIIIEILLLREILMHFIPFGTADLQMELELNS